MRDIMYCRDKRRNNGFNHNSCCQSLARVAFSASQRASAEVDHAPGRLARDEFIAVFRRGSASADSPTTLCAPLAVRLPCQLIERARSRQKRGDRGNNGISSPQIRRHLSVGAALAEGQANPANNHCR